MSELPCGSKQGIGSPESPAEESEEDDEDEDEEEDEDEDDDDDEEEDEEENDEEEDDDDDEEEDEEEEEDDGDDNPGEEDEEDEESGGEKEEQEDADVAKIQVPDKGIEDPEMAKFTAVKGSEEIPESGVQVSESDLNAEAEVQPEQSAVDLLEEDDVTRNLQSEVIEETGLQEDSAFNERAECENIDKEEVPEFTSDVSVNVAPESPLCPSPAPRTLDVEDDCLVSAIRVESRISDEEEVFSDHFSNPTGALRTPLQSSGSTPRNNRIESNCEDDGEDEDWDDEDDEELLEVEKSDTVDNDAHFEADTPEFEKANVTSVLSQSDEGEIGDEEYPATSDLNVDNGVVLHDGTGGDDDDDGNDDDDDEDDDKDVNEDKQEEINDTKKSSQFLTLLGQKEEPESSDNSWDSVSDKEKAEEMKDGETLAMVMDDDDTNKDSLLEDNRTPLETNIRSEDGTVKHLGDEEHIPVSMIVGNEDDDDNDDDDDDNQSNDSEHCLNVSDKEEDKNQDSDSDVQQMQYDFASRTVKVTEISNSDDSQDNSLVEDTGDIELSADNHSEDQQNTVAKLDESSSEGSLPNPTSPSPVHSALHSPSPSRVIHCPSEDNDQESQITVVDRFIDVKHPSPNLSSLDGIDDCFGLAEETENDLEAEKEEKVAFHEDMPQTDIDDVDLNSHSDKDAVKEERENLSSEEYLDESVMHQNISEKGSEQENVSSEDESEEDDVAEDDDKAETDHDEEGSEHDEEDDNPQKTEKSQDKKRDFMSELGIEKEDEEEDSPWDSESGSDSPRKKPQDGSSSPTKSHKTMASICEENNEVLKNSQVEEKEEEEEKEEVEEEENEEDEEDEEVKNDQNNKEKQLNLIHREPVSVLSTIMHSKGAEKKTDFMEELGLGDVDDLEDASDWDSASTTSKASKNIPACKLDEELAGETPVALPVVQEQDLDTSSPDVQEPARPELKGPSPTATPPLPNPRTHTAHPGVQSQPQPQPQPQPRTHRNSAQKPESDEESDWDTNNTSSPTKATSPLPNIVKTETATPPEDGASKCSSDASEPPDMSGVAKADDMKVKSKSTALWESSKQHEVKQEKGKEADTNTSKPIPEQEGNSDRGSPQKDDGLDGRDSVSPRWQARSPRSKNRRTPADEDEQKRTHGSQGNLLRVPAPQQARPPFPVNRRNGDPLSVFDDSSLSEVSEDEGRYPSSRYKTEKSGGELEMADDFEDLTQSSDTATEELDSAASGYRHASLLINQLDSSSIDSVSMVKLQNMFREYEHTIQRERSRHSRLVDKVSQLEQERSDLRLLLEETRDNKSSLEHLRLELETDLNNLKFLLKQEQEKHQSASMLYDKTREQLRRKEEQHRAEAEERQKVELNMRNLELEMRALMNTLKQLEEDRNETQRLLAHERSARALQEELLNSHLRKQQDIEEENLKNLNKSNEVMSQLTEVSDRERELQQQVCTLQEELSCVRAELDRSHCHSQQEESRLSEERDALRERLEDARRDLKLNEEALTQTVFQYNGQLSALKAECSVVSAKLEHERQTRQQLEAEAEASRARLQAALQETERCQALRTEAERALQRERDEHQRAQDKRSMESGSQRDTIQSLSQKLSKAEARANSMENECHRTALSVTEKGVLLETVTREREQAQARLKELEAALQNEREQSTRTSARHEAVQERLAQAQSEAALLRQQLEEANNKGTAKERAATDAQERFADVLNQLRADGEERVQLVEERSKELAAKNAELREQNYKLEQEKSERESSLRQLQQELADSLKKLSMCEASLEVNTRYRNDLEEEKVRTQKELDRLRGKLQESEEQYVQGERRINSLKGSLDEKEREVISTGQKLQEVLAASTSTEQTIKQLEEAVQRLEIENARLEAAAKQQTNRIEVLQKEVQEANVMRHRFEDLVTNLQSSKMTLEDQLSREMQKQSMLSHNAQDSQALWEEELKSRSRIGLRLAELEKEKGELSSQMELEKKKAKKIAEQKKAVDSRLDEEMKRNTELQKEMYRLRTLVKTAKKKLREQDGGELGSPFGSLRGEMGHRHSEAEGAISRMKAKVDDLQGQLEREASRCSRLEEVNKQLKEQLGSLKSLRRSHECLERSKRQLEEEVTGLRRQVESGLMDQSQAEQYRRETEERARQEIRHKLEEVNLFLQTQAASQEALEQIKAANEASQRAQLEQRIKELEGELSRVRTNQQDSQVQRDSSRTELERYKQLYTEELRLRKSFAAKLDRSNERLAEANTKLLSERQRSKSLLTSSIMNGSLAGPGLDAASLGSVGAYGASLGPLNRSLGLGSPLLGSVGEPPSNRVEAYLAKMQSELEKNISKELDCATAELDGGSARMSPVGSASGSQKNLNFNMNLEQQDPLSRATQQYLEVLKKNYMI